MVYIPGGEFFQHDDRTTHPIAGFWLDRTEVTVKAFRAFVEAGYSPPWPPATKNASLRCTWGMPDADDLPINCIDWYQAEAYCLWAKKRLPTAQEWGWAAQGRDERRLFPWGEAKPSCDLAIVDMDRTDDVQGCGRNLPWPVGAKTTDVTRDGVFDMFGNVGEPTSSGANAEERSPRITMGSAWARPGSETRGVARQQAYATRESWSDNAGVRCAKDLGPAPPCAK